MFQLSANKLYAVGKIKFLPFPFRENRVDFHIPDKYGGGHLVLLLCSPCSFVLWTSRARSIDRILK